MIINYFHLWKLCNRKPVLEYFQKFISQERHIRILNAIYYVCYILKFQIKKIWKSRSNLTLELFVEQIFGLSEINGHAGGVRFCLRWRVVSWKISKCFFAIYWFFFIFDLDLEIGIFKFQGSLFNQFLFQIMIEKLWIGPEENSLSLSKIFISIIGKIWNWG